MKKKKNSIVKWSKNKKISIVLIVISVIAILYTVLSIGMYKLAYYNDAADLASTANTRDLILTAVQESKKDAPVEAKTGNVYFPEARLYLPNPGLDHPLTYRYDTATDAQSVDELTVSTNPIGGTNKMYAAKNHDQLFAAVPTLQSCSRGIQVMHTASMELVNNIELIDSHKLANGKDAFIYLEKACPELKSIAESFKTLQSY